MHENWRIEGEHTNRYLSSAEKCFLLDFLFVITTLMGLPPTICLPPQSGWPGGGSSYVHAARDQWASGGAGQGVRVPPEGPFAAGANPVQPHRLPGLQPVRQLPSSTGGSQPRWIQWYWCHMQHELHVGQQMIITLFAYFDIYLFFQIKT